ncbi:CHAT domain-containing protein [Streptomyces sp. NBC_00075]|uniref:CHAT domain-containing protein n=1 Tax=Streptomyces sp. NBC_00075 TaxID=2975641 RepID=UPI0032495ACD
MTVDLPPDDELRETLRGLSEAPGVGHPFGAAPGGTSWERVFRPLVAPLVEHSAEGDPIWLVPSGILHHVPLHAVGWRDSVTLCERNPVTVTPSATVTTRLLAPRRGAGGGSVPLVAGSDAERPLAHARTEVETAATALGADGERLVGERATKTAVLARIALGGMDIVHLACHGRFDAAAPLDSWIQPSPDPPAPGPSDRLTARELCGLRLDVRLVTLGACERLVAHTSRRSPARHGAWRPPSP